MDQQRCGYRMARKDLHPANPAYRPYRTPATDFGWPRKPYHRSVYMVIPQASNPHCLFTFPLLPRFTTVGFRCIFIPENGLPEAPRKSVDLGRIYHYGKAKLFGILSSGPAGSPDGFKYSIWVESNWVVAG